MYSTDIEKKTLIPWFILTQIYNKEYPLYMEIIPNIKIKYMSPIFSDCYVIDIYGNLYGTFFQKLSFGINKLYNIEWVNIPLPPNNKKFLQYVTGGEHLICLIEDNTGKKKLYAKGFNNVCQCGITNKNNNPPYLIPLNILKENQYFYYNDVYIKELTKCDKLEGIDFKSIYATICFSAGITTSGELYAWGLYRVDADINLINLEKPCFVQSESNLPVLVDYVTIFNILFAIGRILENGNYVKKVFYLEKNINNDLDYYYLKEFKDIKIEDKDSINVPMKIYVGYEKIYVLYVNGNNLLKEIEEVNNKEEINQIIECEIIQNNHIQSKKEENNIEKIKEIYISEKLNIFIDKLNTLSDKIIKKFVKEMNEINDPYIEYDKFIENLKGKNEMLDLLSLFKGDEKENFEGKILFKYLKYRISLVENGYKNLFMQI